MRSAQRRRSWRQRSAAQRPGVGARRGAGVGGGRCRLGRDLGRSGDANGCTAGLVSSGASGPRQAAPGRRASCAPVSPQAFVNTVARRRMTCHSARHAQSCAAGIMRRGVWIDTHCHLDAAEFDADRDAVVARARAAGVAQIVIPAVDVANFERGARAGAPASARLRARHPSDVHRARRRRRPRRALRDALARHADDPRLVAVGEIGLDHFVAGLDRERQATIFAAQLAPRRRVRAAGAAARPSRRRPGARSSCAGAACAGGFAHAFNGSEQQAGAFVELGFRLGFGGAVTFERALQDPPRRPRRGARPRS